MLRELFPRALNEFTSNVVRVEVKRNALALLLRIRQHRVKGEVLTRFGVIQECTSTQSVIPTVKKEPYMLCKLTGFQNSGAFTDHVGEVSLYDFYCSV